MSAKSNLVEIKFFLRRMKKNSLLMAGVILGGGILIVASLSNLLVSPRLANIVSLPSQLCWGNHFINWGPASSSCPGNAFFWLGTDYFGRGVLSMIILALPLDLEIAFAI